MNDPMADMHLKDPLAELFPPPIKNPAGKLLREALSPGSMHDSEPLGPGPNLPLELPGIPAEKVNPDGSVIIREALSPHGLSRKARRRAIRSLPRKARKELQRQRESGVKPNGSKSA